MFSLFAIPLVDPTVATTTSFASNFFSRPIDVILFDLLIWFGWIPLAITIAWGIVEIWKNYRIGLYVSHNKFTVLAIDVPAMTEQTPKSLENFFSTLYASKSSITWKEEWIDGKVHPVFSFEIISTEGYIQFLVRTQTRFRDSIEAGIYAHYPDAEISEVEDYTPSFPTEFPNEEYEMWGAEHVLDRPSIYPIRTYVDFEDRITGEIKDPLGHTLEQLAKMRPGEHFWIQILVQPSSHDWTKEGAKRLNQLYGKKEKVKEGLLEKTVNSIMTWPAGILAQLTGLDLTGFFGGAIEEKKEPTIFLPLQETKEAEAIYYKISKVGLGVKIRTLYVAKKNVFVKVERTTMIKGILNQYANLSLNKFGLFIPQVPKDDYFWMRWQYAKKQRTLMSAYKNRSWGVGGTPFFLNVEELASLWHFPTIGFKAPLVKKAEARRAEPPVGLPITFEENTLPGFVEDAESAPIPGLPIMPPSPIKPTEVVPTPKSPTDRGSGSAEVSKIKLPTQEEDSFVPPNLPI